MNVLKRILLMMVVISVFCLAACGQNGYEAINNNSSGLSEQPENPAFYGLGFSFVLPKGYEKVRYTVIDGSIAEAVFIKDGRQYTFRMAKGELDTTDIEIQPTTTTDGIKTQSVHLAGNIPVNFNPGGPGLAEWKTGGFSFSLYTDNCDGDIIQGVIFDLAKEIQKQTNPLSLDKAYFKLWDVSIGKDGYSRTGASYIRTWQGKGYGMYFSVCPEMYLPLPNGTEKVSFNGREFYTDDHGTCWDGADQNGNWISGTTHTRSVVWYSGGCAYSLSANTDDKNISLDIISPQTAIALESDDSYQPSGLEPTNESWQTEFKSGDVTVTICVFPETFGRRTQSEINKGGQYSLKNKDGFEYYESSSGRKPDDPNVKSLVWETNGGQVHLYGTIPFANRNDFSADEWDFINADLAMNITKQLETKALPIKRD